MACYLVSVTICIIIEHHSIGPVICVTNPRENTVKHLIQMMSILEVEEEAGDDDERSHSVAEEWLPLHQDTRYHIFLSKP